MAEKKHTEDVVLGKKFAGEKFSTVKSADDIAAERKLQEDYAHENAVPLSVYFSNRRITDLTQQRMMESFTKVRKATMEAFDEIFAKF